MSNNNNNELTSSVIVSNIQPYDVTTIHTTIPPQSPFYIQNFTNMLSLDPNNFNYISRVTITVDTAGIYNVKEISPDNFEYIRVIRTGTLEGEPIIFPPGNYTLDYLVQIINSRSAQPLTKPAITLNRINQYALRTIINYYEDSVDYYGIDFTHAPTIQEILGLFDLDYPDMKNIITSRDIEDGRIRFSYDPKLFTGTQFNSSYIAKNIFDSTAGLDSIYVANDLIKQSNLISQNFLISTSINVAPGEVLVYQSNTNIPLSKVNFSNINWKLLNRFNEPYSIFTPIEIYTEILSQKK